MLSLLLALYFDYGSNISYDFLKERLKNGEWLEDGWHRQGVLEGSAPKDLGVYVLEGYEFGYTLDASSFGDIGTSGNVVKKEGGKVYGVLYDISENHLKELDKTESVPLAYERVLMEVHSVESPCCSVQAWVYVGNPCYVTNKIEPDPVYIELLKKSGAERKFPSEYIEQFFHYLVPSSP